MTLLQKFEVSATIGGFQPLDIQEMKRTNYEERGLEVPNDLMNQAADVGRTFDNFLGSVHRASPRAIFARKTVISEAFPNLVFHGLKGNAELQSTAKLTVERHREEAGQRIQCVLAIDDHTPPFSETAVPDPRSSERIAVASGRGTLMMQHFGATISQVSHPGGRTKTMIYSWAEDTMTPEEIQAADAEAARKTS